MESSCNWEDMIPLDSTSRMRGRGQGKTGVEDKIKHENEKCGEKLARAKRCGSPVSHQRVIGGASRWELERQRNLKQGECQ